VRAYGLHFIRFIDRDSSVMEMQEANDLTCRNPVVNIFGTVRQFLRVRVLAISTETRFADAIMAKSIDSSSDLVIISRTWSIAG
jgi:hypothetical protein